MSGITLLPLLIVGALVVLLLFGTALDEAS